MAERNICLTNDSFPPVIDGVANAVTNYARVIEKDYGSATVVTPYYPDADDSVFPFEVVRYPSIDLTKLVGYRAGNPLSAEVVQRLEEKHFDLIHTHCPVASTVLARILRDRIHVPLVFTYHTKFDIDIAKAVWLDYCDCHMLDTIAREPLWRHLINYRCGTGHSVSFVGNVHEGPHALNGRNTTVFKPGMIVTDEPGVYEAGQVGIRIENELECYHKADNQYGTFLAFRPLTFVPIATSPIVPGVLTKDELDWLNNYHRTVFTKLAPHLNDEERVWLAEKCAAIGC